MIVTGKTIFYVEDDKVLAQVLEWQLKKLGYTVCGSARSGAEAIAGITGTKPDLVILDTELRGTMDGFEVGDFLAKKTTIPFIYMSSYSDDKILERAKRTGPESFILKPVNEEELRIALKMAL